MANGKHPETEGEHIIALYGHIEGLKTANENFHEDLHRVEKKVDQLDEKLDQNFKNFFWYVAGALGTVLISILGLFSIFAQ